MAQCFFCNDEPVNRLSAIHRLEIIRLPVPLSLIVVPEQTYARHLCKPALKIPQQSVLTSKLTTHEEYAIPLLEIDN